MNQNRCWPGVPNRYRTSPASRATRPKSIATVGVKPKATAAGGAGPAAEEPPATTIFTDVTAVSAATPGVALELAKSTEHPFKKVKIRSALGMVGLVHSDQSFHRHVPDQDTRHAERHSQDCRDLRNGSPVPAESEDRLAFRAED